MRNRAALFSSAIVLSAVGVFAFAAPANAVDTPVSVEVEGGNLSISNPTGAVVVTGFTATDADVPFTITLGTIVVDDARGSALGWTVAASAVDFDSTNGTSISLAGAAYTLPTVTVTGDVTVVQANLADVSTGGTVATGTASGVNTATLTPSIAAVAPAGTLAGTYTTVVVHSVV